MKRFFRKGRGSSSDTKEEHQQSSNSPTKQEGRESPEELNDEIAAEEMGRKPEDANVMKRRGSGDHHDPHSSVVLTSTEDFGQRDDDQSGRRPRPRKGRDNLGRTAEDRESSEKLISSSRKVSSKLPADGGDSNGEAQGGTKPRPLPRRTQGSTSLFLSGGSEDSEEGEEDENQEIEEILPARDSSSRKPPKGPRKETKTKTGKRGKGSSSATGNISSSRNDSGGGSTEDAVEFVSLKNITNVPKVDTSEGGGHYFSTVYNCKVPVSSFKVRARLLKYPKFKDQELWNEEKMAVVDDRVFEWQEKVFSKSEVKKYQKLGNCFTDQERKYHKQVSTPTHGRSKKSVGRFLYSYVTDDLYVTKKKMRLLTRKCPVPHTNKEKTSYSNRLTLDTSTRSLNSEGDSFDLGGGGVGRLGEENFYSDDDSIDFDEPMSSSTPMPSRKSKDNKNTSATEIAKAEKKARERKEKELRELDKRNAKLKEVGLKKEKDEEKRRQQEEAKISEKVRKLEAIETKEKELKAAYMKKYKYSKRPSVPLGARMRSVRLTPSPRKLNRRKKSQTISRSSEISELQDDEEDGDAASLDSVKKAISGEAAPSKVGTEMDTRKHSLGKVATSSKYPRKFYDRAGSYKNAQNMFIMASIPYFPGRCREVVVCMIQSVPGQQMLVLKPGFGYRNIETKRNTVFRISCELHEDVDSKNKQADMTRKSFRDSSIGIVDANIYEDVGFFENVPKNELRLSVFGEITSAEGFDESPLCIYYAIDIPKGWRNDSLQSNTEGMTHTCFTNHQGFAHFSHEFSFQLVFSLDFLDEPNQSTYPTPVIALMAVSMNHPSPRIVYEGYGYVNIPMTPGSHFVKTRLWKPRPRTVVERMRSTFLDITPSLQDMKLVHFTGSENSEDCTKANLIGLQTDPSGTIKIRLHVIHQTPIINKEYESNLDLLEKMSSATILKSVQAVIQAFQRARKKAENIKSQYD